jgi:hydrogenase/urease accessory protein HupE
MSRSAVAALAVIIVLGVCSVVYAHELQPGALALRQVAKDRYEVTWRAPFYLGRPHPAKLQLPDNWRTIGEPTVRQLPDSNLHRRIVAVDGQTINGSIVGFPGLEGTITDVFVRISRLDGTTSNQIVRPGKPYVVLRGERPWYVSSAEYLSVGFHHIILGVDHLLFVLGLLIIVQDRMMLVKTITAFTVAHSITLALATLGYAQVPTPPLNAAIALSILFLGPEIVRVWRGETSFTIKHPWVVAFAFGLLHGFGFASGLSVAGMPRAELAPALLFFNVGVELGQLGFVALIFTVVHSLKRIELRWPAWAEVLPGYAVGSLGAYWTIQRVFIMLVVG